MIIVDARTTFAVNAFATCLGIGFGGGVVCLMTVLGNYFGLKAFALLSGIAIAINTTLSALAPYIAGEVGLVSTGEDFDERSRKLRKHEDVVRGILSEASTPVAA